ncbi:MAG: FkbM family methyltransferase [Phycisphaeraceae bacterium]|nr:FkbM family methyltransferase [Phycisphaeraceae bacterium]
MIVEKDPAGAVSRLVIRTRTIWRAKFHRKFAGDIAAIAGFLPRGATYLDIGAREGRFTSEIARCHGGDCKVYAFEPVLYHAEILRHIAGSRGNVVCVPAALTSEPGEFEYLRLVRKGGKHGHAVFPHPDQRHVYEQSKTKKYVVEKAKCARLDDEVDRLGIDHIAFIKIDVEGHEMPVLLGGAATIERFRPTIQCEIGQRTLAHTDEQGRTVVERLADLGYRFYDLDKGSAGAWSDDAKAALTSLRQREKHTDYLFWHPAGPVGGGAPGFRWG